MVMVLSLIGRRGTAVIGGAAGPRGCRFPAIYNFGDSNSDTGGISAAMTEIASPNGETFFGHPSGRFCDGRLIIDFIGKMIDLMLDLFHIFLAQVNTIIQCSLCSNF